MTININFFKRKNETSAGQINYQNMFKPIDFGIGIILRSDIGYYQLR